MKNFREATPDRFEHIDDEIAFFKEEGKDTTNLEQWYKNERYKRYGFSNVVCDLMTGEVGLWMDGKFLESEIYSNMYVCSFGDDVATLSNVYRVCAELLKDRVNLLIDRPEKTSRNFVNGGMYGSGAIVQETIIYTPYTYGYNECKLDVYQAIFTFATETYHDQYRPLYPQYTPRFKYADGSEYWVKGVRVAENSNYEFQSHIAPLPISKHYKDDPEFFAKAFPWIKIDDLESLNVLDVQFKDLVKWIDVIANLIKVYYFDGLTYEGKFEKESVHAEIVNASRG